MYGTEEQCQKKLIDEKWGNGFKCPKCDSDKFTEFKRDEHSYHQCCECGHQSSLTSGTLFHGSKLPLRIWFLAIYLISEAKKSISALELHRLINVNYKTAWLMRHKIMQVMVNTEEKRKLKGRIEVDDAYLGGKRKGGKRGRGAEGKQPFITAVQTTENKHPVYVKLTPIKEFKKSEIKNWALHCIEKESTIVSDGLKCFTAVESICNHEIHIANDMTEEDKEENFKNFNIVLANVKTSLTGTFHSFDCRKYASRYLAAIMYRFNRRFNLNNIFNCLLKDVIFNPPITAKQIVI